MNELKKMSAEEMKFVSGGMILVPQGLMGANQENIVIVCFPDMGQIAMKEEDLDDMIADGTIKEVFDWCCVLFSDEQFAKTFGRVRTRYIY